MDELVDGHFRAEETGDIAAILDGFNRAPSTTRSGGHTGPSTAPRRSPPTAATSSSSCGSTASRWCGAATARTVSSTSRPCTPPRPAASSDSTAAAGAWLRHVFDVADGRIARENAWLDLAGLRQQPGAAD
jgi:hypothetical protein